MLQHVLACNVTVFEEMQTLQSTMALRVVLAMMSIQSPPAHHPSESKVINLYYTIFVDPVSFFEYNISCRQPASPYVP